MAIGVRLKGKIVSLIEVTGRELSACILNDWLWQGGGGSGMELWSINIANVMRE